ncbi:GIY-YIG nuclease [Candidatus Parcubacteria bacterium]|nr:MAG: GIY-YIG nuclease [Candidatus Parcubacteria bacterium]
MNRVNELKPKKEYEFFVYILASEKNGTLYTGVTNSLFSRIFQHKLEEDKNSFTAKYNINKLVYYEKHEYVNNAIKREKQIKKWKRDWKLRLIEEINPNWEDYFEYMI